MFGDSNRTITKSHIDEALDYLIDQAFEKEMRVVFNAASMSADVNALTLEAAELPVINKIEGFELTTKTVPEDIIKILSSRFKSTNILLTLGAAWSIYADKDSSVFQPAMKVVAIDNNAAGDTYVGFFLAGYSAGKSVAECLTMATSAAALCVTRKGAATSIASISEP